MTTLAEIARDWHAEQGRDWSKGTIILELDRALLDARIVGTEDVVALLEVAIKDYRVLHGNYAGEIEHDTDSDGLLWRALNAAHAYITSRLDP